MLAQARIEKLSMEEIKRLYLDEWVVLVDYDWPNMTLTAGVVYAHSPDRLSLRETIKSLRSRAVIWTGRKIGLSEWYLSRAVDAVSARACLEGSDRRPLARAVTQFDTSRPFVAGGGDGAGIA